MVETNFIKKIESLPPLPTIAHRIQSLTDAPNVSAEHVAKALRHDPAIASRILRVANSPFYGTAHKVTQISRAVVLLGTRAEMACRRRDAESGVCFIPRVFTVFDLKWVEQQWQE